MGKFSIRYLIKRKGFYYWYPLKKYTGGGFICTALGSDIEVAKQKAMQLNLELDKWRTGALTFSYSEGTIGWLCNKYQTDSRFLDLSPRTRDLYADHIALLTKWAGDKKLEAITRPLARAYYEVFQDKPRKAQEAVKMGRLIYNFGKDIGLKLDNPFEKMRIKMNKPRKEIWTQTEYAQFINYCKRSGRPSLGIAVLLALDTGQRQSDVLKMNSSQYDGESLTITQDKTGELLAIPLSSELKNELNFACDGVFVINEETGNPYKPDNFRHLFSSTKSKAGIPNRLQFLDFRRTAVVRLAKSGCTIPEIASITGHRIEDCQAIINTYLPRNIDVARQAIAKLEIYKIETNKELQKIS